MLEMPSHRLQQYPSLEHAAKHDEIFYGATVGNPMHVLLDDGAVIQNGSGVMRRGPNQFYATLISLSIGVPPGKSGQKGVVNVYDRAPRTLSETSRSGSAYSGHHDQFHSVFPQDFPTVAVPLSDGFPG